MTDSGTPDLSELPVGSVFVERFRLERVAGRGGMGVVFQAIDEWTGQKVALKVLHRGSEHGTERFQREALLLAQLQHEGLVAYIASGHSADGRHYLAMEWLEGHDLATHLGAGPLSVDETLRIATRIAGALAVAHDRGILHRDLALKIPVEKPGPCRIAERLRTQGYPEVRTAGPFPDHHALRPFRHVAEA